MNIDAPELSQPYGMCSRDTLVKYLGRKLVTIQQIRGLRKFDIYGRMLVNVWSPLNHERMDVVLVRNGCVWMMKFMELTRHYLSHRTTQGKNDLVCLLVRILVHPLYVQNYLEI